MCVHVCPHTCTHLHAHRSECTDVQGVQKRVFRSLGSWAAGGGEVPEMWVLLRAGVTPAEPRLCLSLSVWDHLTVLYESELLAALRRESKSGTPGSKQAEFRASERGFCLAGVQRWFLGDMQWDATPHASSPMSLTRPCPNHLLSSQQGCYDKELTNGQEGDVLPMGLFPLDYSCIFRGPEKISRISPCKMILCAGPRKK